MYDHIIHVIRMRMEMKCEVGIGYYHDIDLIIIDT
jgi:hypothetical protein